MKTKYTLLTALMLGLSCFGIESFAAGVFPPEAASPPPNSPATGFAFFVRGNIACMKKLATEIPASQVPMGREGAMWEAAPPIGWRTAWGTDCWYEPIPPQFLVPGAKIVYHRELVTVTSILPGLLDEYKVWVSTAD